MRAAPEDRAAYRRRDRASTSTWTQEGIYIAFSPVLNDPSGWTAARKLVDGAAWYPQVMGLEQGVGTDKQAGEVARFFIGGRSDHLIVFGRLGSS